MASVRAATAAAVAGLAAVAAWSLPGSSGPGRLVAGEGVSPASAGLAWQLQATDALGMAASAVPVAVIDTGADVGSPAFAGTQLTTYDVRTRTAAVDDTNGHGTFVASLAATGTTRLLVIKAADAGGALSAQDEARAIRYAVDHGARIVNLSIAGSSTSPVERDAVRYAAMHGVLLVAAAGNDYAHGNPIEYPAALLQPAGSNGRGGVGLSVGATTRSGSRAAFSGSGTWLSLAAPGDAVFGALARRAAASSYPRMPVVGSAGPVGFASGTSFAAPQVAAAAALAWGANPALSARQVADILEQTASGHGTWSPELGYGVIDVAAAVARARAVASGT